MKRKNIKSIGNELRNIRILKGLNLKDVAAKAGVTSMYISEIERDRKKPSDELIEKLAVIYNVDEKSLFESFGRVSEEMLETLVHTEDNTLFDIIYDISKGKLSEDKKKILMEEVRILYNDLKDN